ncbi:GIY-YIG nuclease family protein [Patescibacteria group bacterium]
MCDWQEFKTKNYSTFMPKIIFYYVYVLISLKDNKLYIGYAKDLKERKQKHDKGFVKATKNRRPLKLIYCEAYLSERDAKQREIYLKGGKGHNELKIQLRDTFKKINYKYK